MSSKSTQNWDKIAKKLKKHDFSPFPVKINSKCTEISVKLWNMCPTLGKYFERNYCCPKIVTKFRNNFRNKIFLAYAYHVQFELKISYFSPFSWQNWEKIKLNPFWSQFMTKSWQNSKSLRNKFEKIERNSIFERKSAIFHHFLDKIELKFIENQILYYPLLNFERKSMKSDNKFTQNQWNWNQILAKIELFLNEIQRKL